MPDTLYRQLLVIPFEVATQITGGQRLTKTAAIDQLPPGKTVHYFHFTEQHQLMGRDMDRKELYWILDSFPAYVAGAAFMHLGHGIAIAMAGNAVFYVATKTPLLSQENYHYHGAVCPACKTAHEISHYPHADNTTTKLRMLCRNCGAQWWHDATTFNYNGVTPAARLGATG